MEAAFAVVLVEKRQLERAAVVDGARLDDGAPAGDAVARRVGGEHRTDAGVLARNKLTDGPHERAVLIAAGEKRD